MRWPHLDAVGVELSDDAGFADAEALAELGTGFTGLVATNHVGNLVGSQPSSDAVYPGALDRGRVALASGAAPPGLGQNPA
jgi:hypothetical protein